MSSPLSVSLSHSQLLMRLPLPLSWLQFAWVPLEAYKTTEAPRWTKGYSTAIACTIVSTGLFFLGGYLHKREEAKRARLGLDDTDDGFGTGRAMGEGEGVRAEVDDALDEKNRKADANFPEHVEHVEHVEPLKVPEKSLDQRDVR